MSKLSFEVSQAVPGKEGLVGCIGPKTLMKALVCNVYEPLRARLVVADPPEAGAALRNASAAAGAAVLVRRDRAPLLAKGQRVAAAGGVAMAGGGALISNHLLISKL